LKYIFGLVNSRRFGKSLGIDLSPDKKSCNFDCLYCELDRAKPTNFIQNEPNPKEIVKEVKEFLKKGIYPDVITITANGEPTLYSKLDTLINELNKIKGKSKLLILSNGSTIDRGDIREILKNLDMVKISLDAVDQNIFKKVDRPLKDINIKNILDGLKKFRDIYSGELIIEIMLVRNINDIKENIEDIAKELVKIKPDRVDLGTIDRPPAYRVYPVSNEKLIELSKILEKYNLPVNLILRRENGKETIYNSVEEILEIIKRRPLTLEEIESLSSPKVLEEINKLLENEKLKIKKIDSHKFLFLP